VAADIGEITASINALTQEYYTIAHNLANVSTVGYKRRRNEFVQELAGLEGKTSAEPSGEVTVVGVLDFSQGALQQTQRGLDVALSGKGFFVVETPTGPLYTRNGVFHTNQQGQLVDSEGRLIAGEAGPIVIPQGMGLSGLNISEYGGISAGGTTFGKFRLMDFGENEKDLVSVGTSCFQAPEGVNPVAAEEAVVKQGYRESSNVNAVEELVKLMAVTRLYESNMKILAAEQQNSSSILSVAAG